MIVYCSKCRINWAALLKSAMNENDDVESCPLCLTDSFLEEGNDITAYIMCPFTAKIYEVGTNKELIRKQVMPVFPKAKAKPALTKTQADYDRIEEAAIDAYHASGKEEDYWRVFKENKPK